MNIQTIVVELRDAGFSDSQIAEKAGCASSSVSMWANGNRGTKKSEQMFNLFQLHQKVVSQKSAA